MLVQLTDEELLALDTKAFYDHRVEMEAKFAEYSDYTHRLYQLEQQRTQRELRERFDLTSFSWQVHPSNALSAESYDVLMFAVFPPEDFDGLHGRIDVAKDVYATVNSGRVTLGGKVGSVIAWAQENNLRVTWGPLLRRVLENAHDIKQLIQVIESAASEPEW